MPAEKEQILQTIIARLEADCEVLLRAARAAHDAATHEENIPASKYETLALEASYIAQGQANRAGEIRQALTAYRQLQLQSFAADTQIRLTALVTLEDEQGRAQRIFLGPAAGGLKIAAVAGEILVITADSPLGRELLGLRSGDGFEFVAAGQRKEYEIVDVV